MATDRKRTALRARTKLRPESFHKRVIAVIKGIPEGRVATYGQVAALSGNPRAARQVVRTLHTASDIELLPWHRVINAKGSISLSRGQGFELQRALLRDEGVPVTDDGRVRLNEYQWNGVARRRG